MMILPLREHVPEEISRGRQALELWRRMFDEWYVEFYIATNSEGDRFCFFCMEFEYDGELEHDDDCIYIAARKLVTGE